MVLPISPHCQIKVLKFHTKFKKKVDFFDSRRLEPLQRPEPVNLLADERPGLLAQEREDHAVPVLGVGRGRGVEVRVRVDVDDAQLLAAGCSVPVDRAHRYAVVAAQDYGQVVLVDALFHSPRQLV